MDPGFQNGSWTGAGNRTGGARKRKEGLPYTDECSAVIRSIDRPKLRSKETQIEQRSNETQIEQRSHETQLERRSIETGSADDIGSRMQGIGCPVCHPEDSAAAEITTSSLGDAKLRREVHRGSTWKRARSGRQSTFWTAEHILEAQGWAREARKPIVKTRGAGGCCSC